MSIYTSYLPLPPFPPFPPPRPAFLPAVSKPVISSLSASSTRCHAGPLPAPAFPQRPLAAEAGPCQGGAACSAAGPPGTHQKLPSRPPQGRTPRAPPPACQEQGGKGRCAPRPRPARSRPGPSPRRPKLPLPQPGPPRAHLEATAHAPRRRETAHAQVCPGRGGSAAVPIPSARRPACARGGGGRAQRPPRPCVAGSAHARGVARRFELRGSWRRRRRQVSVPVPVAGAVVMAAGPGPPRGALCPGAGGLAPALGAHGAGVPERGGVAGPGRPRHPRSLSIAPRVGQPEHHGGLCGGVGDEPLWGAGGRRVWVRRLGRRGRNVRAKYPCGSV